MAGGKGDREFGGVVTGDCAARGGKNSAAWNHETARRGRSRLPKPEFQPCCALFLAAAGSAGHKPRRDGGAKPAFFWKSDATTGPGEHFGGKGRPTGASDRSKRRCRSLKLLPGRSRMPQNRNLDRCQFRLSRCAVSVSVQAVPLRRYVIQNSHFGPPGPIQSTPSHHPSILRAAFLPL